MASVTLLIGRVMARVEIKRNSWLSFANLLEVNDTQGTSGVSEVAETIAFWDTPDFPEVVPQVTDTFITVDENNQGNLDLIAFDAYGDEDLWWVIALANNIELIPTDVVINRRIRIPNKAYVDSLIGRGEQK